MQHPAKYTDSILKIISPLLSGNKEVLDPFAGTGKLRQICPTATLLEIEPEWAKINNAIVGDCLNMPIEWTNKFDVVCTSPTYGNRMADTYTDGTKRITYTNYLGRSLSKNNSGSLQWGEKYRVFHTQAWKECYRVLKPQGMFILNISDHIRKGKIIEVTKWHTNYLQTLGFVKLNDYKVETPRMGFGKNSELRVNYESVIVFSKSCSSNDSINRGK